MAKQTINIGTAPNDGTGTPLRTAFDYCNLNFTELYTAVGPSGNNIVVPGTATITGNLTVDTNTLFVDAANNRVGILTATPGAPLDILGNGLADALLIRGNDNANCKIRMVNSGGSGEEFSLSVGYPGASNSSFVLRSITAGINRYIADQTGAHFWATNAGTAMTLNSTGLGVGVVLSAWNTNYNAIQLGLGSSLATYKTGGVYDQSFLSSNAFENTSGNWRFVNNGYGAQYFQYAGAHWFRTSTTQNAGGANQALTWNTGMKLDENGRLILLALTTTPATLATNGELTMTATSNTNLRFSYRGSDGTTRVANITLA
jgi:hypothetical protein